MIWAGKLTDGHWMSRTTNSRFETHLPFFREENVGCYCWGFVKGRTQTYYPWGSPKGAPEPKMWHHDVVDENGRYYSDEEIAIIKECIGQKRQ